MGKRRLYVIEVLVAQIENNREIIERLAQGNLGEEEMAEIGVSLATKKTLGEIRMGKGFPNVFDEFAKYSRIFTG